MATPQTDATADSTIERSASGSGSYVVRARGAIVDAHISTNDYSSCLTIVQTPLSRETAFTAIISRAPEEGQSVLVGDLCPILPWQLNYPTPRTLGAIGRVEQVNGQNVRVRIGWLSLAWAKRNHHWRVGKEYDVPIHQVGYAKLAWGVLIDMLEEAMIDTLHTTDEDAHPRTKRVRKE